MCDQTYGAVRNLVGGKKQRKGMVVAEKKDEGDKV
jgi:hypothetical protein